MTAATTTKIHGEEDRVSGPHDLINDYGGVLCDDTGSDVVFSYGPDPLIWEIGQEDTSTIVATFKTNAMGTYTFTSNILPTA